MKLPWVGRTAFDMVVDERDRLRETNDTLISHLKRIDRVEAGLTEEPRKPAPQQAPIPEEIKAYVKGFEPNARSRIWAGIIKQNPTGDARKWEEMVKELPRDEEDEDE